MWGSVRGVPSRGLMRCSWRGVSSPKLALKGVAGGGGGGQKRGAGVKAPSPDPSVSPFYPQASILM